MSLPASVGPDSERRVERLSPHVWRAALPVHTLPPHDHTNAYVIASAGRAIIVDPGSEAEAALALLDVALDQAEATQVDLIVLTHSHPDHIDGVGPLLGRSEARAVGVHALETHRLPPTWPLRELVDGETIALGAVRVHCLHTPGHSPGHLALLVDAGEGPEAVLAGDLVAAEGSVWVGVPDGDMTDYLASLERVANTGTQLVCPGHGPAIRQPRERLAEMGEHRHERERQVVAALAGASMTPWQITEAVYPPLPRPVLELAEKSVEAHLIKLTREGRVTRSGSGAHAKYSLV